MLEQKLAKWNADSQKLKSVKKVGSPIRKRKSVVEVGSLSQKWKQKSVAQIRKVFRRNLDGKSAEKTSLS